jgi:hypothetical protein
MLGITATGMRWTYEALAKAGTDPANAAKARQFAIDIGTWMRTKGYQAATKGLYYGRSFANCEPVNDSDGACSSGGNAGVARALSGEAINAIAISYALQPDINIKTVGDAMMSAMYSKPGVEGIPGDGTYLLDLEDNGYMYLGNGSHKWFGMYFGLGANWAWPAVRLQ